MTTTAAGVSGCLARTVELDFEVDLGATMRTLQRGVGDPSVQCLGGGEVWWATRLPAGGCMLHLRQRAPRAIAVRAWGPGAEEAVRDLPITLGAGDDPAAFDPLTPQIAALVRRAPAFRVPRTMRVAETGVLAVIEQRVPTADAFPAIRRLVMRHGRPLPVPTPRPMRYPLSPRQVLNLSVADWHQAGVDPGRARAARGIASRAVLLDAAARTGDNDRVYRVLHALPHVGEWTAAQIGHRALGDADALPVGNYHLGRIIGWSLVGRVVDIAEAPTFVEPWRPQRYRLWRVLLYGPQPAPPRRGPKLTVQDHRYI